MDDAFLTIKPFDLEEIADDIVIFDSDRDNGGNDILAKEIITIIDEINGQSRKISKKSPKKATTKN